MRISTIMLAVFVILFTSCNRFQKTKSGMPYKISGTAKEKFKAGQFVKAHMLYKIKDSVLNSTYEHIPVYFQVDSGMIGKYNFTELIFQSGVGNTIDFKLSVDSLKKYQVLDYSKIFKKGDYIIGKIEYLKSFTTQKEQQDDLNAEIEKEKQREIKAVKEYAAKNKFTTKTTPGGAEVVIENEGTGMKADSGTKASVYYKGYLMKDGKEFDSNIKNGVKGEPLVFNVGTHQMIAGFDEGVKFFAKGGKGKILLPAMMGYGMQGSPGAIPPYANLVFEIEVADVTIAGKEETQRQPRVETAPQQDPHQHK